MIKVAIIGCGAVVEELHLAPLKRLAGRRMLEVKALVDPDAARAARLQRHFSTANIHSSPDAALATGGIDLTLVASPAAFHLPHALAAIAAGSHVFVEKPMATSLAAAEELCAAAAARQRLVAVGLPRRYFPHFADVAKLVRSGALGSPLQFIYREGAPYDWPITSPAAFRREKTGGGVLVDKGAHIFDTLEQIFGALTVTFSRDDSLREGVECNALVGLRCAETGATGEVQLSWDQPLRNGLWIRGPRGEINLGLGDITTYRRRTGTGAWEDVAATSDWPVDLAKSPRRAAPVGYLSCIEYEWIGVMRAVLHGELPGAPGTTAVHVIGAIEQAYATMQPLDLPWLSAPERTALAAGHWRAAQ